MCVRKLNPSLYDSATFSNLGSAGMRHRVGRTYNDQKVSKIDIFYNAAITVVGVALVAFCVSIFVLNLDSYGWVLNMAPHYSMLGVVGLGSLIFSTFSTKRMIELCIKKQKFDRAVNEAISSSS